MEGQYKIVVKTTKVNKETVKKGAIYDPSGKEIFSDHAPTFAALQKKLRGNGKIYVPTSLVINKKGETFFFPRSKQ
jgi:hypothetical protein